MAIPNVVRPGLRALPIHLMKAKALTMSAPFALGVHVPPQDGDFWCWAAVSVGVIAALTSTAEKPQCALVKSVTGHTHDCCDTVPPREVCDVDNQLEVGLAAGGITAVPLNQTFLFSELREQLFDRRRPVGALITFPHGGANHFVEIDGFIDATKELIVNDSLFGGPKKMPMKEFTFDYAGKGGRWTFTYTID